MMVYAYVHEIKQFRENELSIQKSVFKRLRVEHCISWRFSSGKTANSRVFWRHTNKQIYRRTQTLNPPTRM